MKTEWMKKCCNRCPFAKNNTLFLHPERAEEFAYMAENPFTDFPCHKTADYLETDDGENDGYVFGETSVTCHGFKTLQMAQNASERDYDISGFIADGNGFECPYDMIDTHTEHWELEKAK